MNINELLQKIKDIFQNTETPKGYLNYKTYAVKGINSETNRRKTLTIVCHQNCDIENLAQAQGLLSPYEITEVSLDEPTESQLNYAKILKIKIPKGASLEDVSCLISNKVEYDSEPNPGLVDYANYKNLCFSKFIGKKRLYNLIFNKLELRDKIAFFCFAIYRYISDDREANLEKSNYKKAFYDFADIYLNDEKFIKSMNTYDGKDLRYFGTLRITEKDTGKQIETYGGSETTSSYKTVNTYLKEKFKLSPTKVKTLIK